MAGTYLPDRLYLVVHNHDVSSAATALSDALLLGSF